MRIIDLQIEGFGKLNNKYVNFSDGINVVTGHNEAGKSTLHSCIRAMFYGMQRAKGVAALTDTFSHFKPWFGKAYGAIMRIEHEGHVYRIERDFYKDPVGAIIFDETTLEAVAYADDFLNTLLCNLGPQAYDNTISISQLKSTADETMATTLKQYIVNMDTTGNRSLNCEKAKKYLSEQKRNLAEEIEADAAKKYASNCSEIKRIEKELSSPDNLPRVKEAKEQQKKAESEAQALSRSIDEDRDFLRRHGVHSSEQVQAVEDEYLYAVHSYEEEIEHRTVQRNRAAYITCFTIALLGLLGTAYIYATEAYRLRYRMVALSVVGLAFLLGIIFLIVCAISKGRLANKEEKLGELLAIYSGFDDVSPERIERVGNKFAELKKVVTRVEEKEAQLAELTKRHGFSVEDEAKEEGETNIPLSQEELDSVNVLIEDLNALKAQNVLLKDQITKNDRINDNMEAIDIAMDTIDRLAEDMKDSIGVYLNKEASKYINQLTNGAYDSLSVDDELNVFLNTAEKMVPVEQVSSGTNDQIYMALRLAGARLVQQGQDKLPLIFDDSFVNYDEGRLASALKWMANSYEGQVIIFSCHTREAELLADNHIEFNKIAL